MVTKHAPDWLTTRHEQRAYSTTGSAGNVTGKPAGKQGRISLICGRCNRTIGHVVNQIE